jgi:hypothetical protein
MELFHVMKEDKKEGHCDYDKPDISVVLCDTVIPQRLTKS